MFSGLGLIVYLVAWLIMTPAPEDYWSDDVDRPGRRIYKDPDDKKVFGVCGGIAKAYDVDPTIVRLVFVVLAFLGGAGILAYLVLAVLLDAPPVEPQVDVDEDDEQDDGTKGPEASDDDGDGDSGDEPAAETGDEPAGDAGE